MIFKVFSGSEYAFCYSKEEALKQRVCMQELGFTKVYIKRNKK
jgi:hypothetical protein